MNLDLNKGEFRPRYKLIAQYPGMNWPIGTVFGNVRGWTTLQTISGHGSTIWEENYFSPWVNVYFEIMNV
jgi:hypothetical protein